MGDMTRRDFDAAALTWDDNPGRVAVSRQLAAAIRREVPLQADWEALDYGCGTGLVTLLLSPDLGQVIAADSSAGMLEVLAGKLRDVGADNVTTRLVDLTTDGHDLPPVDFVFSSMTFHHLPDPAAVLGKLAALVRPGGWVAIADLDAEDGSFHGDNTGVFHHGFSTAQMAEFVAAAGLQLDRTTVAHTVARPDAAGVTREYPVLLTVARKAE